MNKLVSSLLLVTCFASLETKSQSKPYISVNNAEQIPWERIESPDSRFIVAGEAHHISCIYPFQLSHLKYLVSQGFRNLIWEVPFSYSLIAQQYITSGKDSFNS